MVINFADFDPQTFSFLEHPVLVLEDFWTDDEMTRFRRAMAEASWTALNELRAARQTFRNCGNWVQSELRSAEREMFVKRTLLPCVQRYIDSFESIKSRVMSFNYYAYAVGDCLSIHDDMDSGDPEDPRRQRTRRRLALTTYLHERWDPNWGGELITYSPGKEGTLDIGHCIMPKPNSLVIFTVPTIHRLCRIDPLAGRNRRLSIAGWFMTRH